MAIATINLECKILFKRALIAINMPIVALGFKPWLPSMLVRFYVNGKRV